MAEGGYPNKIKRPCLEDVTLSMGPGAHPSNPCAELQVPLPTMNPGSTAMGIAGHSLLLENNPMNGSAMGSPFVVPPTAEMGLKGPAVPYYDKVSSMPAVDQELQDLLEELTKIQEPSSSELDLEKILGSKPEEPLVLDHPQATLGTAPKPSVQMPHLESLASSKEFASSCSQAMGVSLHIPPSSAGISYALHSTSKQMVSSNSSIAQAKSQDPAMLPVALPPLPVPQWHHAHQLKVLAASKQGSATKQQGPTPGWSGLPPPGLSPPYRPVPSPQPPPPFSPQSLMVSCMSSSNLGSTLQGSPNTLLSSMATSSNAALGTPMPYAPEKTPSAALHQQPPFSPQSSILANLMSSTIKTPQGHLMSALPTSNPGPSPPYRPEQLSSPGLPQQSFTPQCSLTRGLTPTSNPLSQQQQQQANAIFKPITTNSSKTLSMIMQQGLASPSPGAPEPFTFGNTKPLSHFISEPGPQKTPSMTATSRQPSLLHYLQQPTLTQAPSATATATATLQQQPDDSSFLLQQMMQQPQRFQRAMALDSLPSLPRQQEKQSSGLTAMTPEQGSEYLAQQMRQFQAVQEQVTSKCSCTKTSPQSSRHVMSSRAGLPHNNLSPRMVPSTRHQSVIAPDPHFPIPTHSGQTPPDSLGIVCQQVQSPKAASWVAAAAAAVTAAVSGIQQHFDSNSIFTKAPVRVPPVAPAFPSQQAAVAPNQVAPGGRPGRKARVALANPHCSLLGIPKSLQQGMASFSPLSPIQGIEPPSYMASAAATATASTIAARQSPGPFSRMGVPLELPPLNMEAGVTEALLKGPSMSPDEDWVCNLRLIDDILEEHAAAQNAAAQSAGQVPQDTHRNPHIDTTLGSNMNP